MRASRLLVAATAIAAMAHGFDASAAGNAPPKVAEVVKKLQARYDATKDFTADFTQTIEAATLGQPLKSQGVVFYKRPGRMRWEFTSPDEQTIVADGKTLWVYQPEHRQVLKAPFRAAFQSATPVSFLFGVGKLASDFDASLVANDSADVIRVKLVPKREREIGTLILDVNCTTYDIVGAEVTDPLGNVTRLAFSNVKRDVGVEDDKFTFRAPPGTDVVEPPGNS